jgi:hypothetical protein
MEILLLPFIGWLIYLAARRLLISGDVIGEFRDDFTSYSYILFFTIIVFEMLMGILHRYGSITQESIFAAMTIMVFISPIVLAYINYRHYRQWESFKKP